MTSTLTAFNICCKGDPKFFLTIRNNQVVFAPANANDENQRWYIHRTGSSFAAVHKLTGLAIKHPGNNKYVELTPFTNMDDKSILWTESNVNDKEGYKNIVSSLNPQLPFWYPWCRIPKDGIRLQIWNDVGSNGKLWKMIERETVIIPVLPPIVRIRSKLESSLFLSIKNGGVVVATSNASDEFQQWYLYKNEDGSFFIAVNKSTGQAIKQPQPNQPLQLVSDFSMEDATLKWTEHKDEDGSTSIKIANNDSTQVWDVEKEVGKDGTRIIGWNYHGKPNQRWIVTP